MKRIKKINENEIKVDGCVYRKVEEPKPEFKVADWAKWESANGTWCTVFYITDICGTTVLGWDKPGCIEHQCLIEDLLKPTRDEIESHLKKICDEKYPVGTKFNSVTIGGGIGIATGKCRYYNNDHLTNGAGFTIYSHGKWAEIIPDKKTLPKTKEELAELLRKFQDDSLLPFPTLDVEQFLQDYE